MKWITALNLEQWSDTIGARTQFPGLVADLIRASASNISSFRFPRGDKGQIRGFDGVLDADSNSTYIPNGESLWEFGVNAGGPAKATEDYYKRSEQVDEATRKVTTFVFVTPRTWDSSKGQKREDWIKQKTDLGQWKDVWYIDGSMLEDWLSLCPAVSAWYSKYVLNTIPVDGVCSTDEFWSEFSTRFTPQLVEKVLLADRGDQARDLMQQLNAGAGKLLYAADTPDEVVAFAVAAIRSAEPAVRLFIESRTLVVDSEDAVRRLTGRKGLIFLLRRQARNLVGLLAPHSPTVVSAGADEKRSEHVLLNRPRSSELANAFMAMGYGQDQGYDLARKCGRSLAVLARLLASGNAVKPEWIDSGEDLLPALLAGGWRATSKPDTDILCALAATEDYENVESPLRRLSRLQDPPVERIGDVWAMRASVDAFVNIGHLLGRKHLERFSAVATAVFTQVIEPPKATDVFRPSVEREAGHSRWLRDGLMTTLLHMAVLSEPAGFTVTGSTPTDFVNGIVRKLPGLAKDHRLLAALQDQLALLAEAAPVPFLEALEQLLEGDASGIKPIFAETEGFITPRAYHYGLLWALEVVAWDPNLLLRVALCLARLASIDPGGTDSNRPLNSLRAIFLAWSPNTSANAAQRTGILRHVVETVPGIAWPLLTKLLPKPHDSSSSTQKPKFREYQREEEVLTYGLIWESQTAVIRLALDQVGHDSERWATLINAIHQFPEVAFNDTVDALRAVLAGKQEGTPEIWDILRKEVNRHKAFAETNWALRNKPLALLDELVTAHAPKNPILLSTWLFDDWMPDVPGLRDANSDPSESIEIARSAAIAEVYAASDIEGLVDLSEKVKLPQHVAFSLRSLKLDKDKLFKLLLCALKAGRSKEPFLAIVVAEYIERFGKDGEENLRIQLNSLGLAAGRIASLMMSLPETKATWDYVATFGEAVGNAYWETKHSYIVDGTTEDLLVAVDQYARRGRFIAALNVSNRRLKELSTRALMQLLSDAIPEINSRPEASGNMTLHILERAFDDLDLRDDAPIEEMAKLEFAYLPIFRVRKRQLVLHRLMAQRASLFVEIVSAVFKPEHGEARNLDESAQRQAVAAYELLDGFQTLPGQIGEQVDREQLLAWCLDVRDLAVKADRLTMSEQRIGHLFARAPAGSDGVWPHEAVRLAIESLASVSLERGTEVERINMRGVYSKDFGEGGMQERGLAAQALGWAEAIPGSPRTSAMLRRISETWTRYAEQADIEAKVEGLRW